MKFKIRIENAREELIVALEFIKEVENENQTRIIDMTNTAIDHIDSLLIALKKPKLKNTPKYKPKIAKFDPLKSDPYLDDPSYRQMKEIWDTMNTPDAGNYKLMVLRLEPQVMKGIKICGYLQTHYLPTTIPDVIEKTGNMYGGGKYQIKIVDDAGKYVKSKTFEVSGLPKIKNDLDGRLSERPENFKFVVLRLKPQTVDGKKISGYLRGYGHLETIESVMKLVEAHYGGGKYQIKVVDLNTDNQEIVKSKTFEVSGDPKPGV